MAFPTPRTLGGIGALLTCPCHAVPLLLLLGSTVGSTWLARHLPLMIAALAVLFAGSLWLLVRSAPLGAAVTCDECRPAPPSVAPRT